MSYFTNVPSPHVDQKANRLLRQRRVKQTAAGRWDVVGDTMLLFGPEHLRKVAHVGGKSWTCTCPTRGLCSHIVCCQRFTAKRAIRLTAADGSTTLITPKAPAPPAMTADEVFAAFELY
jgi:hypothetical protein